MIKCLKPLLRRIEQLFNTLVIVEVLQLAVLRRLGNLEHSVLRFGSVSLVKEMKW